MGRLVGVRLMLVLIVLCLPVQGLAAWGVPYCAGPHTEAGFTDSSVSSCSECSGAGSPCVGCQGCIGSFMVARPEAPSAWSNFSEFLSMRGFFDSLASQPALPPPRS